MRHAERALTHGEVVWLDTDHPDSVASFLRRTSGEAILSVVNLSNRTIKVRTTFPEPTRWSYDTLIADGAKVEGDESSRVLNLEGFGYLVAKRRWGGPEVLLTQENVQGDLSRIHESPVARRRTREGGCPSPGDQAMRISVSATCFLPSPLRAAFSSTRHAKSQIEQRRGDD